MTRATRRRRLRRFRRKVGAVVLPIAAPSTLRLLSNSWKVERIGVQNMEHVLAQPGRLATLWHGRMIVPMAAHRNMNCRVLVSPSDDGSLVNSFLGRFGYGVIRGSSNKNPARAVREMLEGLREGGTIVITPDGPRGPRHSVNPGPAWMASETGFPILPCGLACDRAWHFNSWDHFTVPKLRARVVVVYGEPLYVAKDASSAEIERATEEMRRRMLDAERHGFERLGMEPDW